MFDVEAIISHLDEFTTLCRRARTAEVNASLCRTRADFDEQEKSAQAFEVCREKLEARIREVCNEEKKAKLALGDLKRAILDAVSAKVRG